MYESNKHLFDLPNEILLNILKKLNHIDVLYSLIDNENDRLNILAQDQQFINKLDSCLIDENFLQRFYRNILPCIHHGIKELKFYSENLETIFNIGNYPNLSKLELDRFGQNIVLQFFKDDLPFAHIFKYQITDLTLVFNDNDGFVSSLKDYTRNIYAYILNFFEKLEQLIINSSSIISNFDLSLCDLPSTTFSSLILRKLSIHVSTFDDCLYLLDGRLKQLNIFIVRISDMNSPSIIVHNHEKLINLKSFSLICHNHICTYDNRLLPLIHRMSNLRELTLCLTVLNRSNLIDGIHLQNEILVHLLYLKNFTFDIRSWKIINDRDQILTNDDIQRTFTEIGYTQIECSIRYFYGNYILCHVFTLPFTFDYLQCITNNFPNIIYSNLLYLSICDVLPFEHEFFVRISKAFPLLKHLTVNNTTRQTWIVQLQQQNSSIVIYPYLTYLSVMGSDVTYTEEFLLRTRSYLPCLTELRVDSEKLKTITENFTRNATRINCKNIRNLITEVNLMRTDNFSLYFPLLSNEIN